MNGLDRTAKALAALFAGSSEVASLHNTEPHNKATARTRRHGLNPHNYYSHVRGDARIGAVPFTGEHANMSRWACCDLDVNRPGRELSETQALEIACTLVLELGARGILGHLERSKSRGWHLWIFLDRPTHNGKLRGLLLEALRTVWPGWEAETDAICPRAVSTTSCGNGTWLPLCGADSGGHTKWHNFRTGEPLAQQVEYMEYVDAHGRTPADVVEAFVGKPDEEQTPTVIRAGTEELCTVVEVLERHEIELTIHKVCEDRIRLECPFHRVMPGHSSDNAVLFASGVFACSSCGAKHVGIFRFVNAWLAEHREEK